MIVNEYAGIVREVIDAVNTAFADGDVSTVKSIELTREEMDEFLQHHPFRGNTGKFYGEDERGSLLEIESDFPAWDKEGQPRVTRFRLKGILFYTPAGE